MTIIPDRLQKLDSLTLTRTGCYKSPRLHDMDRFSVPAALVLLVWVADGVGHAAAATPHPAWEWVRLAIALAAAGLGLVVILATRGDGRWLR